MSYAQQELCHFASASKKTGLMPAFQETVLYGEKCHKNLSRIARHDCESIVNEQMVRVDVDGHCSHLRIMFVRFCVARKCNWSYRMILFSC